MFGPGDEGANWWDDKCVFHPIVVREPSWRMYYYGRGDDRWGGARPALLSTGRIGMALSEDGIHWNHHRGPLPHGALLDPDDDEHAFDSVHVGCSDVFFHDGKLTTPPPQIVLDLEHIRFATGIAVTVPL